MDDITGKYRFPAVGRCVYCGDSESQLSDEHIIPYSLNGELILPKSSCETCREITRKNEELCTFERWGMFAPMRSRLKLQSRRRWTSKNQIKAKVIHADGSSEIKTFPADTFPSVAYGAILPAAGILNGLEPTDTFEGKLVMRFPEHYEVGVSKESNLKIGEFRWNVFFRLLAKIACSYAASTIKREEFHPMLIDIILCKANTFTYLIGGKGEFDDLAKIPEMHRLDLYDCTFGGTTYTMVGIHLFGILGLPSYHVVVSKRSEN